MALLGAHHNSIVQPKGAAHLTRFTAIHLTVCLANL